MTSHVVDLAKLLAPLPGESPCGVELRWEPIYDEIRRARVEDNRDMLAGDVPVEAQWSRVIDLAEEALGGRSKDLMLAAWLTEAITVRHGFAGLRDGLVLLRELLEQFWEQLYPLPDEGDLEPRVAPLVWLMDPDRGARLPNRLRDLPLTPDTDENSWNFWKSRYAPPKGESEDDDLYERRKSEAEERARRFEDAVGRTPLEFVQARHAEIQAAQAALQELDRVATERFGELAPAITPFRAAIEEIEVLVRRIVRDKGGMAEPEADAQQEASGELAGQGNGRLAAASGPIQSREDAFRRLAEVSSFLRRTEPQSPVPLLIDRAIAWGRMPFEQLLREMIKDESVRGQVNDLLGMQSQGESE